MEALLTKLTTLGGPLLLGAGTTVAITLASLLVAIVLGLTLALVRLLGIRPVNWLISAYVEAFRNTPVLAQVFIIYFSLPYLGLKIDPFPAAVIGLGLNGGAMLTEVFRAGLSATGLEHVQIRYGDIGRLSLPDGTADLVTLHQVLHFLDEPLETWHFTQSPELPLRTRRQAVPPACLHRLLESP